MVQFASYLRRVLCKTRLIFPRINGPTVCNSIEFLDNLRMDKTNNNALVQSIELLNLIYVQMFAFSRCWLPFHANECVFSRNEQQKV